MKTFFYQSLSLATFAGFTLTAAAQELEALKLEDKIIERLGLVSDAVAEHIVADGTNATGQIVLNPAQTQVVTSFFSGQLAVDQTQIGDAVTAGQELAQLRSREVAQVITAYIEAASRYESAQILFQREEDLRAKKLTTEESYLAAKAAFLEAKASRTATLQTALLARTQDELTALQDADGSEDITQIPLKSNIAGRVISKLKYTGESVETNEELFRIADLSTLLVEIQVPLQAGELVKVGNRLSFQTVIGNPRTGEAIISKISPVVNQESLSITVFASLKNKDGSWMPGTPVNVSILDSAATQVIAVPTSSIVKINGKPHVFRVAGSGGFTPVPLALGMKSQDFTEVKEGVQQGAMICVKGASLLLAAWEENASN